MEVGCWGWSSGSGAGESWVEGFGDGWSWDSLASSAGGGAGESSIGESLWMVSLGCTGYCLVGAGCGTFVVVFHHLS